jgi:hypothetical protein
MDLQQEFNIWPLLGKPLSGSVVVDHVLVGSKLYAWDPEEAYHGVSERGAESCSG